MLTIRQAWPLALVALAGAFPTAARAAEDPERIRSLLRAEFRRAAKEVGEIPDASERVQLMTIIGSGQARVGDRDAAQESLRLARLAIDNVQEAATPEEKTDHVNSLIDLAEAYNDNKDQATAQALALEAARAVQKADDFPRRRFFLAYIGKFQARIGKREDSIASFRAAIKAAEAGDEEGKIGELSVIATFQFDAGDRDGAGESLREAARLQGAIRDDSSRIVGWGRILRTQNDVGGVEECLRMIEDATPGRPPDQRLLEDILRKIGEKDGDETLKALFGKLGSKARDKDRGEERRTLDRIRVLAKAVEPGHEGSRLVAAIAEAEGRLGDFDEALRVAKRIGEDDDGNLYRVPALAAIATSEARAGDKAGARASSARRSPTLTGRMGRTVLGP